LPDGVICPRVAFQFTDLSVVVPSTVAENCRVPPVIDDADPGVMTTPVTAGTEGAEVEDAVTITFAVPDLVASALLVAVMVSTTAVVGAV
jgi:hypothetical protein